MHIKCDNASLILIDEKTQLRSNHKYQLKAWGFNENAGIFTSYNYNDEMLTKLVCYFDNREIQFNFDENALRIYQQYQQVEADRKEKIEMLRKFKNGTIDLQELQKHNKFLSSLKRKLKEHQVKASLHLYLAKNAANLSVPGSGKTTVILSVYERLKKEGVVDVLYVVGPLSCFGSWKEEFYQTLGRHPKTTILAGGDKNLRIGQYYNYTNHNELYHFVSNKYV